MEYVSKYSSLELLAFKEKLSLDNFVVKMLGKSVVTLS
jgi:hypothetical protein